MKTMVLVPRGTVYDVDLDGERLLTGTRNPEYDAARAMRDLGLTGPFQTTGATGRIRMTFTSIEETAKWTIEESDKHGPRRVKWRPYVDRHVKGALKRSEGTDVAEGGLAMKRKRNDWTVLDARLIELWADFSITTTEIGEKLGGVTKNAVIGRAHRLFLPHRPTGFPWNQPDYVPPPRMPKPEVEAAPVPVPIEPPPPPPPLKWSAPIEDLVPARERGTYTLLDLKADHCRWPVNEPPRGEPYLFCGEGKFNGSAYCEYHARLAFSGKGTARQASTAPWVPKPVNF